MSHSIILKCNCAEDLRRFTFPSDEKDLYNQLHLRLAQSFGVEQGSCTLFYQDNEGDNINVSSSLDLDEAITHNGTASGGGTVLRLEVRDLNRKKKSDKGSKTDVNTESTAAKNHLLPKPCKQPNSGSFSTLRHLASGNEFDVQGITLPNGRVVFKLKGEKGNVAIGPKGRMSHGGGQGPWAQFSVVPNEAAAGFFLQHHGCREQGLSLGFDGDSLAVCTTPDTVAWQLLTDGVPCVVPPPKEWYEKKIAAKAAKAAAPATAVPKQAPVQDMLSTIAVAGNHDRRSAGKGSFLSVHDSKKADIFDKNGTWSMVTSESKKASIWSIQRGGWIPDGLVHLTVSGNLDGRTTAQSWSLMVASDSKAPHSRDRSSAYVLATRPMDKKGGLWTIDPSPEDPSKCTLRYAGNRDGRTAAEGFYLAVHGTAQWDRRDSVSQYVIVTKDVSKASLWDIRPFWGKIPAPPAPPCKQVELDVSGNPKIGFHTAKKIAKDGIHNAFCALLNGCAEKVEHTPQSAAASIQSLRVACDWVRKKTGLPITVATIGNDEALSVVQKLRDLPQALPRWAVKGESIPEDAPARVDTFIAALGQPMLRVWNDELSDPNAEIISTARMQRGDRVKHTMLRKAPTPDMHSWVDDRTCVPNGEEVTVFRVEGDFTFVQAKNGTKGFVKSKHLSCKHLSSTKLTQSREVPLDQPLFLIGPHGNSMQCNKKDLAVCANNNTKLWEQLTILQSSTSPCKFLIRSDKNGNHLQCRKDGSLAFTNKNDKLWEHWDIELKGDLAFFISAHTGNVMQTRKDGSMSCANKNRLEYEGFRVQMKPVEEAAKAKAPAQIKIGDAVKLIDAAQASKACSSFHAADPRWNGHSIVEGTEGWVEYQIENDAPSNVMIAVQYNAKDKRPLQLSLNGELVENSFACGTTGTWTDENMLCWEEVGPFDLPLGTTLMRLATKGLFPHLKQFRVSKVSKKPPESPKAPAIPDQDDSLLLDQLNNMGFATPRANAHALSVANGDLAVAVDILLTSDYTSME